MRSSDISQGKRARRLLQPYNGGCPSLSTPRRQISGLGHRQARVWPFGPAGPRRGAPPPPPPRRPQPPPPPPPPRHRLLSTRGRPRARAEPPRPPPLCPALVPCPLA